MLNNPVIRDATVLVFIVCFSMNVIGAPIEAQSAVTEQSLMHSGDSLLDTSWAGSRVGVIAPMDIPLILAGNFGELRADHFHTGLDFKTQGQEGVPVLAATDGAIARVKVSPFGYGRALYLSGPEGITTVYAHLQRFAPAIESWARSQQYNNQQFELDEWPHQSFVYEAGDTIGWSGNSGGSGGPHLHFEIRETASQRPLNPLFWNFHVADSTAPELGGIWLLPQENGAINGRKRPVKLEHEGKVMVQGGFRVAIDAFDRLDAAYNRCGIYKAELRWGQTLVFDWELDTLDFSVNRDMNAHAYYPAWNTTGEQAHRMHRLPGNRLPVYSAAASSGVIGCKAEKGCEESLSVQVWDVHGNSTKKQWQVVVKSSESSEEGVALGHGKLSQEKTQEIRSEDGIQVFCPANAFYEDFEMNLERGPEGIFQLGNANVPVAKAIEVRVGMLSAVGGAPMDLCSDKTAVRWIDESGSSQDWYPGVCEGSDFVFSTRHLGRYRFDVDSVAPSISPHSRYEESADSVLSVLRIDELRFNLIDKGVGVSDFEATLDGEWILMRWDPKRERIWYELDDQRHVTGRDQRLLITATDEVGNRSEWMGWVRFHP